MQFAIHALARGGRSAGTWGAEIEDEGFLVGHGRLVVISNVEPGAASEAALREKLSPRW